MPAACQSSLLRPSTFAFRGFEGAKRQRLCRPSGNPVGVNLAWGFPVSDACSRVTLGAVTCLWNGWCRTVLLKAVTFAQPMPAACQSFLLHPSTFAFKVPNGSGSANQVATRWARILLGFPCFGCVLTGDAGGCDVPLEWLMPHGFAQGRYVRPTNACCLPKLRGRESCRGFPVSDACWPLTLGAVGVFLFRMRACRSAPLRSAIMSADPTPCPTGQAPMVLFQVSAYVTSLPTQLLGMLLRLLVFALYSSRRFRWLDLRATAGASMGERTHDVAMSNTKLLAAMPCDLNLASANAAVRLRVAVRALVLLPLLRWTLLASKRLRVSVLAFFFGFFCCGWSFCCCWRLVGEPALLCVRLLNFCTHLSQDLCNLSLRDLAAASLQPGVCSLARTLYV